MRGNVRPKLKGNDASFDQKCYSLSWRDTTLSLGCSVGFRDDDTPLNLTLLLSSDLCKGVVLQQVISKQKTEQVIHENAAQITMSARSYSCAGGKVEISTARSGELWICDMTTFADYYFLLFFFYLYFMLFRTPWARYSEYFVFYNADYLWSVNSFHACSYVKVLPRWYNRFCTISFLEENDNWRDTLHFFMRLN